MGPRLAQGGRDSHAVGLRCRNLGAVFSSLGSLEEPPWRHHRFGGFAERGDSRLCQGMSPVAFRKTLPFSDAKNRSLAEGGMRKPSKAWGMRDWFFRKEPAP